MVSFFTAEEQQWLDSKLANLDAQSCERREAVLRIVVDEIALGKSAALAVLLTDEVSEGRLPIEEVEERFGSSVTKIIQGLMRVDELYQRNTSIETENFRKLLISFAEDVRVVLIMLARCLLRMRTLKTQTDEEIRLATAREAAFLYAPLAHRLGLYQVKTELEDLSLKFTNYEIYSDIAHKLNETKASRDAYIKAFIEPLSEKLTAAGFKFHIKGRTKSIHSIYNKLKKQNTTFDHVYDLFAIRVILDSAPEKEKADCWQVYSIVADMYQPNPKRLRDWLTVPKSNGYECLHTTVLGPEQKWVEVQIRTERMDEIAEKGLAAHWKYKGIKGENGMDDFLKSIREVLENPDASALEVMDEFKLSLYDHEVFVFSPKGDLIKFPKGATALDFAFHIHTNIGLHCVGAKVNGRNVPIKYVLQNGDQVEVLTQQRQEPNEAWLKIVVTSKARNKIKQTLKEMEYKDSLTGKEILERRFKNWKLELTEGYLSNLHRKLGYKTVNDFYQAIAHDKLDMQTVRETFEALLDHDAKGEQGPEIQSAQKFDLNTLHRSDDRDYTQHLSDKDVLVIDQNLKGIKFQLAKCCNPIYGDKVFGFVSTLNGIKIHRCDCPNAPQMIERFGYRIVPARWHGKADGAQYPITLHVVGNDDLGIVTNITSVLSKDAHVNIRSISIDSSDGLFQGQLTIMVDDTTQLATIIKKIKGVRGVKNVTR